MIRNRGDQRRIDKCRPRTEHHCGKGGDQNVTLRHRKDGERTRLEQHPGDDQGLSPYSVRPSSGNDLSDAPDRWVEARNESDGRNACTVRGEEQRNDPPRDSVVQVVHESCLRARAKRWDPIGSVCECLTESGWSPVGAWRVPCLFERDVTGRIPREEDRERKAGEGDRKTCHHKNIARCELRGKKSACGCCRSNSEVAGRFVQAKCEPALAGADEVDLHHYRHGPGESLVETKRNVRRGDECPAWSDCEQQWNGQRKHPPQDQESTATEALHQRAGGEVRER